MFLLLIAICILFSLSVFSYKLCDKGSLAGKFCSQGKVKAATGDNHLPGVMKSVLKNASHMKEIISVACTEDHLGSTAQLVHSLHAAGYYHIVLITLESSQGDTCTLKSWPREIQHPAACVWSSAPVPSGHSRLPTLFHHRHRFNARAARMGYNVMSLDSDVIFFHDPYQWLKSPPLSSYQLLVQRDGGGGCNCGWYYIQNASEDGPVAWLINQVPDRFLRFSEDCHRAQRFISSDTNKVKAMNNFDCGSIFGYEQHTLCDAIASFAVGRPIYVHAIKGFEGGDKATSFHKANRAIFKGFLKDESPVADAISALPPGWSKIAYHDTEHWQASSATIPSSQGSWLGGLGGKLFGSSRGNFSQPFLEELRDDTGKYPSWPDLDFDSAGDVKANASSWIGEEKIAFAPGWLVDAWTSRGWSGAWDSRLTGTGQAQQVVGHIVSVEGEYQDGKQLVKMALDPNWDWGVSLNPRRFFASSHLRLMEVPKIILFHPDLVPRLIQPLSALDLVKMALIIVTLGKILDRAVVFPSILCQSPAVPCRFDGFSNLTRDRFPFASHDSFFSFGSLTLGKANSNTTYSAGKWNRTCFWGQFFYSPCYQNGNSIHPIELLHLMETNSSSYSPSDSNSLFLPSSDIKKPFDMAYQPNKCPSGEPQRVILLNKVLYTTCDDRVDEESLKKQGDQVPIPVIKYSEVIEKASMMKEFPIIYVGSLVEVDKGSLPGSVQASISILTSDYGCQGMKESVATMKFTPWSERNVGRHCTL